MRFGRRARSSARLFSRRSPSSSGRHFLRRRIPTRPATYQLARFPIVTIGSTLTFSIPRSLLGGARWFTFTVAVARESAEETGDGAFDIVPARGTLRYVLTA